MWDCDRGLPLSTILLHVPILGFDMSSDVSRVVVHLYDSRHLPIICLHNTPATYVKAPAYVAPTPVAPVIDGTLVYFSYFLSFKCQVPINSLDCVTLFTDIRTAGLKRPNRRLLKKDVSLDSYTWQRKYAHLTTSLMMAAVDERLKRRFSVSASMEEISTISSNKDASMGSQVLF